LFGTTAIASVSHTVDGIWDLQCCFSHGWATELSSTVLVVGTFASVAVLSSLTIVVERTRSTRLIRRAMSILSDFVSVVYSVRAELVVSTIGLKDTGAKGSSRLRRRNIAVVLGDTCAIVSVVQPVVSDEHTSLAGQTISCISADCEGGRGRSGWSGCSGRGILSFPSACPCESSRGEK